MNTFVCAVSAATILLFPRPLLGQSPVVINQPVADPGTSSSKFGHTLGATGTDLFIGAPGFDNHATADAGRLFVFNKQTLAFVDEFGTTVNENGNAPTAIAGTKKDVIIGIGGPGHVAGGEYVFYNPGKDINSGPYNPEPATGDRFGASVANTKKFLVIGAPGDQGGSGPERSGSAFVSQKKELTEVRLPLPAYVESDEAGYAVASNGKLIAVGAPGAKGNFLGVASNVGAVHIYNAKTLEYMLTLSGSAFFQAPRFGSALAFSGRSLFVGSPGENLGTMTSPEYVPGAGAVIEFDTKTWSEARRFYSQTPQEGAQFGAAIAVDKKRLMVGSPLFDNGASTDAGLAEIFLKKKQSVVARLVSTSPAADQELGRSVLFLDKNRAAVGAPYSENSASDGRVYVFTIKEHPSLVITP